MVVRNYASTSNKLNFDDVVVILHSEDMQRKSIGKTSGYLGSLIVDNKGI